MPSRVRRGRVGRGGAGKLTPGDVQGRTRVASGASPRSPPVEPTLVGLDTEALCWRVRDRHSDAYREHSGSSDSVPVPAAVGRAGRRGRRHGPGTAGDRAAALRTSTGPCWAGRGLPRATPEADAGTDVGRRA